MSCLDFWNHPSSVFMPSRVFRHMLVVLKTRRATIKMWVYLKSKGRHESKEIELECNPQGEAFRETLGPLTDETDPFRLKAVRSKPEQRQPPEHACCHRKTVFPLYDLGSLTGACKSD
jgi:hypothetical protein